METRVIIADLDTEPGRLHAVELDWAARLTSPDVRSRFERRRWAYRQMLAKFMGTEPESLVPAFWCPDCGEGAHGRPQYRLLGELVPLALSASAYQEIAVLAISDEYDRVGVDVTSKYDDAFAHPEGRLPQIANGFATGNERDWARALGEEQWSEAVARLFSVKEAVLKLSGQGLRQDPRQIEVLDPEDPLQIAYVLPAEQPILIDVDSLAPMADQEDGLIISVVAQGRN